MINCDENRYFEIFALFSTFTCQGYQKYLAACTHQ